jgi:2-methylcitrate dehydratase PrpD
MTLEAFARHLRGLRSDVGGHAEAVRLRLFDTLVAARIGAALDDAGPLGDVLGDNLSDRIARWIAAIRSTEVDDIEIAGCVTAGSVVIPAVLLAAEASRADDEALLDAILAGYEAMIGLARAIGGATILTRGLWPTYIVASFGVAAALARLHDLSIEQATNALALALARSAPVCGRSQAGSSPRFLLLGLSAVEGITAVRAAAAAYGGDPTILSSFLRLLGAENGIEEGNGPLLLHSEFKPYPTARQGLAAIEAFRAIMPPGRSADIARVMVELPSQTLAMLQTPAIGRIGSLVNLGCQLSLAVSDNRLEDCRRRSISQGEQHDLAGRVELCGALDLDAAYPVTWGARVEISMKDGTVIRAERWAAPDLASWPALTGKAAGIFAASSIPTDDLPDLRQACSDVQPGRSSAARLVALALR